LELCGVTKILKKLQTILWGQHFELQVDAKALIEMINTPSLPCAPMTRWVAFIQLFSFDLVHKPGKTFTIPDSLSRRPLDKGEEGKDFNEDEEWIRPHPGLGVKPLSISMIKITELDNSQCGIWKGIEIHLRELKRPPGCSDQDYQKIKRRAHNYFLEENQLKKRALPFAQTVVSLYKNQEKVMKALHEELGHRGMAETYRRIKIRFWWEGMKKTVRKWVQSCEACQKRSKNLPKEVGQATSTSTLFERVSMDAVHVKAGRWKYIIVARDDFSGWAETTALTNLRSKSVADWFVSEWICRYGIPKEVTVDGGAEFKKELQNAMKKIGTKLRTVTPYYPEAQGMVERGHKSIKDALIKICGESGTKWKEYLPLVTLADRISTKRTTGFTPFELQFGQPAVLPVDIELKSYLSVEWGEVKTTADLLQARAEQLARKEENRMNASEKLREARKQSVKYWDRKLAHRMRKPLEAGDLVLVYNKSLENQWGLLFKNRWNGPYRVIEQINNGPYELEELDGTRLSRRYAANHIKKFYLRGEKLATEELEEGDESEDEASSDSTNNESRREGESDSGESNEDSNKSVEGEF
jgi:hypothetical protein